MSFRFIFLFIACIASPLTSAEHVQHSRVGSHGMALFEVDGELYAYHLPLYSSPHDYQLLMRIRTQHDRDIVDFLIEQATNKGTVANQPLLTLLPEVFDLNKLIEEQRFSIAARVYKGHFERDGEIWIEDVDVSFEQVMYRQQIVVERTHFEDSQAPSNRWDLVENLTSKATLWIHRIQQRPSFDAVIMGNQCRTSENLMVTSLPDINTIAEQLKHDAQCEDIKTLYLETKDFSK